MFSNSVQYLFTIVTRWEFLDFEEKFREDDRLIVM